MSTYPSLNAYTADVVSAREAYRADREVAAGFCETGDGRKLDGKRRHCWACHHALSGGYWVPDQSGVQRWIAS